MLRTLTNKALSPLGMKLVPKHHDQLFYQHEYEGGEAEYRDTQIRWNKAKFDQVWADEKTLQTIASDILAHAPPPRGAVPRRPQWLGSRLVREGS
jgi:hypothetical protein